MSYRPLLGAVGALVASGLSAAAGASQAAPTLSGSGELTATDAANIATTAPFGFGQPSAFTRVEHDVFRESVVADGTLATHLTGRAIVSANYSAITTETDANIIRIGNHEQGTSTVAGTANTSLHDTVRVTGTSATPGQVILHRALHVTGSADGFAALETREDHTEATGKASLFSNGVAGLTLIPLIDFHLETVDDLRIQSGNDSFDQVFDFSIVLDLNSQTDVDIELLNQFTFSLTDRDGDGPGNQNNLQGGLSVISTASFSGAATVTDVAGNALCGLTISADSGTDWGSIAACPSDPGGGTGGGPGGGSGGGGTGGGTGGIPEPATWALMIGGFGGMGALLRRRGRISAHG